VAVIIGIDTDAKGSIAVLNTSAHTLDIFPIPNREKKLSSGKSRLEVNYPVLAALMVELSTHVLADRIYLEDQWSRPKQDSGATFTFGKTFGDCRTATVSSLLAAGLSPEDSEERMRFVPGSEWKAELNLDSDKNKSLKLASLLFPNCSDAWKLKSKHTSAAEAALLAFWGVGKERIVLRAGAAFHRSSLSVKVKSNNCRYSDGTTKLRI